MRSRRCARIEIAPREAFHQEAAQRFLFEPSSRFPDGRVLRLHRRARLPGRGHLWSRGTAETRVAVVPGGATRVILTLSTGPMSGEVHVSVDGTHAPSR
jgi:hypothetical protein